MNTFTTADFAAKAAELSEDAALDIEDTRSLHAMLAQAAQMQLELDRLTALTTWREIASAPKDGTLILVLWDGCCCESSWVSWGPNQGSWADAGIDPLAPPTHWMPLPASPAGVSR